MGTLVVTSINPYQKIEHQQACFLEWKKVGYEVKTLNCGVEHDELIICGFEPDDVVLINESETAKDLIGKPIPRILPVLYRALGFGYDSIILTNSDIFPAHRKPIGEFLQTLSSSVALCRSECIDVSRHDYADCESYRGGLDVFFFTAEALTRICSELSRSGVAERMTFGVPGWDYYLAHFVRHVLDGEILDGEVFLHQIHKTTYNHIGEFDFFAQEMFGSGMYQNDYPIALAAEFSGIISEHCDANWRHSQLLKRIFYRKPLKQGMPELADDVGSIKKQFDSLLERNKVNVALDSRDVALFISNQLDQLSWSSAEHFYSKLNTNISPFSGYLLLLLLQLVIKNHNRKHAISFDYPQESVHGAALENLMTRLEQSELDVHILTMFATELIDHSIFNQLIFEYIVLTTTSSDSLGLCRAIATINNLEK